MKTTWNGIGELPEGTFANLSGTETHWYETQHTPQMYEPGDPRRSAAEHECNEARRAVEQYRRDCARRRVPRHFRDAVTERELPERGLYLHGGVGTGKTHIAAGLANKAIAADMRLHWLDATIWLADMRASYNGGPPAPDAAKIADCDMLVIDDLGAHKPTEWASEQFFLLINQVYEREDVLVIVTSERAPSKLASHVGERIASRLLEMCDAELLGGSDQRLLKARAKRSTANKDNAT